MRKEVHEIIGDFVQEKRKEKGFNSTKFASKVGVARSTIFNVEKKVGTCISLSTMDLILKALDIPWSELAIILDNNNGETNERSETTTIL